LTLEQTTLQTLIWNDDMIVFFDDEEIDSRVLEFLDQDFQTLEELGILGSKPKTFFGRGGVFCE